MRQVRHNEGLVVEIEIDSWGNERRSRIVVDYASGIEAEDTDHPLYHYEHYVKIVPVFSLGERK